MINHGTITGAFSGLQPDGDGDGVDIDKIAHIENYGVIQGVGAGGVDKNGFANGSEGIALGGGAIYNAKGALISGANNAILVDDGSDGPGLAATTLENHGTIEGLDGFGVKFVGNYADTVINSGTISGSNGLALDLGGGDDNLILRNGSRFIGAVDGGSGYDRLTLDDVAGGTFGDSRNLERLDVKQGTWTLTGQGDFSDGGEISSGAKLVNQGGIVGDVTVDAGGVYAGGGSVGSLVVNGTLQTNTALGTASINRDLRMGSGLDPGLWRQRRRQQRTDQGRRHRLPQWRDAGGQPRRRHLPLAKPLQRAASRQHQWHVWQGHQRLRLPDPNPGLQPHPGRPYVHP